MIKLIIILYSVVYLGDMSEEILINCYGFYLKLNLPDKEYKISTSNFMEGTFYKYIFTEDTTAIIVQCAALTEKYANLEGIYKKDTVTLDGYKVFRSYGKEIDKKDRYWIEYVYKNLDLAIRARFVKGKDMEEFESLLDEVVIVKRSEIPKGKRR